MPQFAGDDLEGARGRDGQQRPDEAAEEPADPVADRRADQDGEQHEQRVDAAPSCS